MSDAPMDEGTELGLRELAALITRRLPRFGEGLTCKRIPPNQGVFMLHGAGAQMVDRRRLTTCESFEVLATEVTRALLAANPKVEAELAQEGSDFALPPRITPEAKEVLEQRIADELAGPMRAMPVPPSPTFTFTECEACGAGWRGMDVDACPVCALTELREAVEAQIRWLGIPPPPPGTVLSPAQVIVNGLTAALERSRTDK